MVKEKKELLMAMEFPQRLTALRKEKGLTQQALADMAGVHVMQIRRYESGATQPTLDVIKRMAIALSVSTDMLIFDKDERGPDDDFKLQFEAISKFDPKEKMFVKEVIDSLILKHEARRWASAR
jgi:transcriptional regulator with XRE-family HTH domain